MIGVIIPARLKSSRLPRKPLRMIHDKSVIQWCYEGCQGSELVDGVYVATPDQEIVDAVNGFGGRAVLTGKHNTALGRCAEAVEHLIMAGYKTAVVVQGDEPMVRYEMIDLAIRGNQVATCLVKQLNKKEDAHNPNTVKAIVDKKGYFIYLSRSVLPGITPERESFIDPPPIYKQVCIMVFDAHFLERFNKLPMGYIERSEGIDLLRYIENGYHCIRAVESPYETQCVDTSEDLYNLRRMIKNEQ